MNPTITIRVATRHDLPRIDELLAHSYPALLRADYPPSVLVTALPLISRANPALVTSGHYFVAVGDDGAICAAGGCTPGAPAGGRAERGVAHVRHVVTDRRLVRRGIGRALMEHAMAHARAGGAGLLDCLATRTAEPFYAALGFATLGLREIELRPGIRFPVIHMQREL